MMSLYRVLSSTLPFKEFEDNKEQRRRIKDVAQLSFTFHSLYKTFAALSTWLTASFVPFFTFNPLFDSALFPVQWWTFLDSLMTMSQRLSASSCFDWFFIFCELDFDFIIADYHKNVVVLMRDSWVWNHRRWCPCTKTIMNVKMRRS